MSGKIQRIGEVKPKVGYIFGFGRMPVSTRVGATPSNMQWGALELEELGYPVERFYPSLYIKGWLKGAGYLANVVFILKTRREIARCDVLYIYTQKMMVVAAIARSIGLLNPRLVFLLGSLAIGQPQDGRLQGLYGLVDRWIFRQAAAAIYYTEAEAVAARKNTRLDQDCIRSMRFAVDADFYSEPTARKEGYVIAIGNDYRRDWKMVASVAKHLPDIAFKVVSQDPELRQTSFPPNVSVYPASSLVESKNLIARANCLLLTTKPHLGFSGTTTMMNALLLGTPVVLDESYSLADYKLVDRLNCLSFPRGDVGGAANCISEVFMYPEFANSLRKEGLALRETYSMRAYARMLADHIDRVVDSARLAPHRRPALSMERELHHEPE
jgi:glycosyltransferase involved in cell wall biosynthesis